MKSILIAAAALFAVLAALTSPVFAQTQPPGGTNHLVTICAYDANTGEIVVRNVQPDQAPVDRGVASEGHPTLANSQNRCDQDATPVPTVALTATPTPTVGVAGERATPQPTATVEPTVAATATPTVVPTAEPTWTPEPEATPEWPAKEPTMPAGPLPSCYPGGPEPCGGK